MDPNFPKSSMEHTANHLPTKTDTISEVEIIQDANPCHSSGTFKAMDCVAAEPRQDRPQHSNSTTNFQTASEL